MFHCCIEQIEAHLETRSSDAQRRNLTFVLYSFVANFVSYVHFVKNYLNWFSFQIVIMKVIGVNVFETQCMYLLHCVIILPICA